MRETIKESLIRIDGFSPEEADSLILTAKFELVEYIRNGEIEKAQNICEEFFSIDNSYLKDLILGDMWTRIQSLNEEEGK